MKCLLNLTPFFSKCLLNLTPFFSHLFFQIFPSGSAGHFVISPAFPMPLDIYQQLLNRVQLGNFNVLP